MTDNLAIWNNLSRTDPNHTKQFSRSGGFKGTAIKPIWLVKRLTEQFGPVGIGWGMEKPDFQLVPADGELLVFCTVECWHTSRENAFYGVGGDKAIAVFKSGPRADDEAFKKAFTDAVGNAFKFVGSGADVHMGQFDDSKYVQEMAREFSDDPPISDEQHTKLMQLIPAAKVRETQFNQKFGIKRTDELPSSKFEEAVESLKERMAELAKRDTATQAKEAA